MRDFFANALFVCFSLLGSAVSACVTDVTILEGSSLLMCSDNVISINASAGFTSYVWSGAGTGTGATITPTVSGTYTVTADDGTGCFSSASIDIIISSVPTPSIVSSEGTEICPGITGSTLSTDQPYNAYNWSTSATDPTIFVSSSGTYSVVVTDGNGCTGSADFTISKINFNLQSSSSTICGGGTTTLTATGSTINSWSTGEFGSSIVVAPETITSYSVSMTNGSCTETLSTTITVLEVPEYSIEDTIYTAVGQPVYVSGPQGFDSYLWSPSENISNPKNEGVTFVGETSTSYNVTASMNSGCSVTETIQVIVVRLTAPEGFSPNNDGTNDFYIIPELYQYPGEIVIWNRWGDVVFSADHYANNWDGTCQGTLCIGSGDLPEGTYFYRVKVDEVKLDGFITLKR